MNLKAATSPREQLSLLAQLCYVHYQETVMTTKPVDSSQQLPDPLAVSSSSQTNRGSRSRKVPSQASFSLEPDLDDIATLGTDGNPALPDTLMTVEALSRFILEEIQRELQTTIAGAQGIADRIAAEVDRVCQKSDRIRNSHQALGWQVALARHRLQKCIAYYRLGSRQGRVDLHSTLSALVYRYIAPNRTQLSFQARYTLIEDFLQNFYVEVLKTFRRENQLPDTYTPRTRLELAEYMAFSEHYAKRRINLPGCGSQRLIMLRAQGFARRQPQDTTLDMEMVVESGRGEEAEAFNRSPIVHQVREQMVANAVDSGDNVLREKVLVELFEYLRSQDQEDCVDYLTLRLQDLSAQEIDEILNLSPRQRDYLQQRFKYHVEKFARSHNWQLVHEWLGADLEQNLGMPSQQWQQFVGQLSTEQQQIVDLKLARVNDQEIARQIRCTPKQVQKRWSKILELAWQTRNQG